MPRWKSKWDRRDKKRHNRQHGMREDGRSVKWIEQLQKKRQDARKERDMT